MKIAEIKGLNGALVLTQSCPHKDIGLCLTLSPPCDFRNYTSLLNKKQVQQLVRELQNWLGETELPWGKCRYNKEQLAKLAGPLDKGTRKQQKKRAAALGLSDNEAIDMGIMSDEY